jgi:hypothetical protein
VTARGNIASSRSLAQTNGASVTLLENTLDTRKVHYSTECSTSAVRSGGKIYSKYHQLKINTDNSDEEMRNPRLIEWMSYFRQGRSVDHANRRECEFRCSSSSIARLALRPSAARRASSPLLDLRLYSTYANTSGRVVLWVRGEY